MRMRQRDTASRLVGLSVVLLIAAAVAPLASLPLPDGKAGIGFDDLGFSPALHRVLAPSGRTGRLNLIDPSSRSIESIEGFSAKGNFLSGHGEGTTSADFGHGLLFASDRGLKVVDIVDPDQKKIVGSVKLGGGPDYVRWVEPLSEVWVTEPGRKTIEYFKLKAGPPATLVLGGTISVADGPESLVVDVTRGRAYTHTWRDATMVIDLASHKQVAKWPNGCDGSRGIALDEKKGILFAGCDEGKAVALDVAHDGKILGTAKSGRGVDIIAYSAKLGHLYLPGGDSATMAVIGVGEKGDLKVLGTVPTASDAHCVAADDIGNAYVCDPSKGRLLVLVDSFPILN
jgi:hypothetical protein